jgi:threonine dehydrogenase-like Zn-dependent dehydrogenase
MRCEAMPDPKIQDPRDAIIKVTACAICGSDLHIYDGVIPGMEHGDVVGHETMGEVVEVSAGNKKLKIGDRVVVPFTISCGECFFCQRGLYSGCDAVWIWQSTVPPPGVVLKQATTVIVFNPRLRAAAGIRATSATH